MNNELVISHDLKINSNMEQLAIKIKNDIAEKYDVVVTEDSVKDTKTLMASINKEKTEFKEKYKSFKDAVLAPLVPLDAKVKEIEGYFDAARTALDNQVKKFEAKKLERAKEVCIEYAMAQCEEKNIDFNAVVISDLFTKLGSVTATGNISGAAKSEIDNRIALIENQILKERLAQEEKLKYEREIAEAARLEAENRARQREQELLKRAEIEKTEAVEKAKEEIRQEARQEVPTQVVKENPTKAEENITPFDEPVVIDGKKVYKLCFHFEVKASINADITKIIGKVQDLMLTEKGIENLKRVDVL